MTRRKRIVFSAVAVALFFAVAEVGLWLAGQETLLDRRDPFAGFSRAVRVFEPDASAGILRTPPRAQKHSFNDQQFALVKPANGLRFFVLGGSSAFGFPWGARVAFARVLGDVLAASYPERDVEAVNAAAMSYGSHRLRILVHELLEYEPDLLVVYSAHNEFVERQFYSEHLARAERLDAARALLYRSRVYSAMAAVWEASRGAERTAPPAAQDTGALLGLDVDREVATDVERAERAEVARRFEANLRAIAAASRRAGVPLVLCTVASNAAGWVPNLSRFDDDVTMDARAEATARLARGRELLAAQDPGAAAAELEPARELAPGHAEIRFRLGQAYQGLERWDDARREFAAARDADARPTRAPGVLVETIRRVAEDEGLVLVDVERVFEEAAPHGLVGFNLFEDYVHPNPRGHRLIAWAVWSAILERGLVGPPAAPDVPTFAAAAGGDPFEIDGDAAAPPLDVDARTPSMLYNLAVVLENQGLTEQAIARYRECLRLDPQYTLARENLARLAFLGGRYEESANEFAIATRQRPERVEPLVGLGESLRRLGRDPEALAALELATRTDPASAEAWNSLGGMLSQLGRLPEAEGAFRRALDIAPADAASWTNLGLARLFQNELDGAGEAFEEALRLRPHDLRARNGRAAVLTERGQLDAAERLFRENLEIAPGDPFALGGLATIEQRRRSK